MTNSSRLIFEPGTIYCGDCLSVLQSFPDECVDLIYIDPPFHSGRSYEVFWGDVQEKRAFEDRWGDVQRYIDYMRPRILALHRVLKRTGSFYYHCDWHAGHYIKVMLDEVFGIINFKNDIVWQRFTFHADAKRFGNVNDSILFYTKSDDYTWNRQFKPLKDSYIQSHFRYRDPDGRIYRLDNASAAGEGPPRRFGDKVIAPPKGTHWRYGQEKIDELMQQGLIVFSSEGTPQIKRYLDEIHGQAVHSIWTDIPPVNPMAKERLGYPTQKPRALLERIIRASSNKNDIVLDAFCGCGTALVAAENLGRQWVGIDVSPTACRVMAERLERDCGMREYPITGKVDPKKSYYKLVNMPMDEEALKRLPPFEFQNWAVLQLGKILHSPAQPTRNFVNDKGIDGKIYLVDNVSLIHKDDETLFGEKTPYIPIQVKQQAKVGRPDIDNFETALQRDKRTAGFFIAFDFTSGAYNEIQRVRREGGLRIYPFRVKQLVSEQFEAELAVWRDLGE